MRRPLLLLFFIAFLLPAAAEAETIYLKARLEAQPGVTSDGDGAALFEYDTVTRAISWTVTYRNLSSALTDAHLHGPAGPTQTAPIVVPMTVTASPLTGTVTITTEQQDDLLAGLWYVNLHTATYGDGEIRGQLEVLDAVTSYAATLGAGAPAASFRGQFLVDLATRTFSWNVSFADGGLGDSHWITGPGRGSEWGAVILAFQGSNAVPTSGSMSLTPEMAAQVVNSFWSMLKTAPSQGAPIIFLFDRIVPTQTHLLNISTRAEVQTGDGQAIAGFVIGGSSAKWVSIYVNGPSLAGFGITRPLADPKVTLVRMSDNATVAENDDWQVDNPMAAHIGSMPSPKESALRVFLQPGAYTAIVSSADGSHGVAIVAVYEETDPEAPFVNISTRAQVLTGESVTIAGFVVSGLTPQTIIVRGLGPTLLAAGLRTALANPVLQLVRQSDNTLLATNDDWQAAANADDVLASGFAPGNAQEAAILVTLPPGAYTAILSGKDGGTGIGIVEVYAVVD